MNKPTAVRAAFRKHHDLVVILVLARSDEKKSRSRLLDLEVLAHIEVHGSNPSSPSLMLKRSQKIDTKRLRSVSLSGSSSTACRASSRPWTTWRLVKSIDTSHGSITCRFLWLKW